MLVPGRVAQALEAKREAFLRGAEESAQTQERYLAAFDQLAGSHFGPQGGLGPAGIADLLGGEPWPGARPTDELGQGSVIPFPDRWGSAQEARAWATRRLRGIPTVAIDGSQIPASKEFAVPISLVQVAWFENYHDPERPYVKDVRDEIVTAGEQTPTFGPKMGRNEIVFVEWAPTEGRPYSQRRFALEMETAVERLSALDPEPAPVVLVDGSLVLSFAGRLVPPAQDVYLQALFTLLEASREHRIPVVGYVDLSLAADLVTMLRVAFDLPEAGAHGEAPLHDAQLLAQRLAPLDRTAAFQCARGDILPRYATERHDYSSELYFLYLETGYERPPARLDFPRWILEDGLLDHVVDVVRAEVVTGGGYPYALETADATAVLTNEDRIAFYRQVHEFMEASGLGLSLPAKSVSKVRRR